MDDIYSLVFDYLSTEDYLLMRLVNRYFDNLVIMQHNNPNRIIKVQNKYISYLCHIKPNLSYDVNSLCSLHRNVFSSVNSKESFR